MHRSLDSRAAYPLRWPHDYLHVETGSKAQGLDPLQVGEGIRRHISNLVRDVLREEQGLQRRRFESVVCDSAL